MSWRSVLLLDETAVSQSAAKHWQVAVSFIGTQNRVCQSAAK